MNRVFKRLPQGGYFNISHKVIKFLFDNKVYSALEGDTIEAALLVNNIFNYGRSENNKPLTSSANNFYNITNIYSNQKEFPIAMRDFKIVDNIKLYQTNKPRLKNKLKQLSKLFSSHYTIPETVSPIRAFDITNSFLNNSPQISCADNSNFTKQKKALEMANDMTFHSEKSYLHTDIVFTHLNIFSYEAALYYAELGLKVIICANKTDYAWHYFYQDTLTQHLQSLKSKIENHPNIQIVQINDIAIDWHKEKNKSQVIALKRSYIYSDDKKNNTQNLALYVINSKKVIVTPNLQEMGFLFQGYQLPAILSCREYMNIYHQFGLIPCSHLTLYVSNDMAYDLLSLEHMTPNIVNAIIDTRPVKSDIMLKAEKEGYTIYTGCVVTKASGKNKVETVTFASTTDTKEGATKTIECPLLLLSSGYDIDLSVLNNIDGAIKPTISTIQNISLEPNLSNEQAKNIKIIGYNLSKNTHNNEQSNQIFVDIYESFLSELNSQITLPKKENTHNHNIDIIKLLNWQLPSQYDIHSLLPKENILFPQGIHFNDFIQLIYQYNNPENLLKALKQDTNFINNHWAIRVLLCQMQAIYNLSPNQIAIFYQQILDYLKDYTTLNIKALAEKISISGFGKPHIKPYAEDNELDIFGDIITPDCAMPSSKISDYLTDIKSTCGMRHFNDCHIIDIVGIDALSFLEKLMAHHNIKFSTDILHQNNHCFIKNASWEKSLLIMKLSDNKFCFVIPKNSKLNAQLHDFYQNKKTDKVIINNVNQSWSYLQLIGKQAYSILETLTKTPLQQIKNNGSTIWIENVQIRFAIYEYFDIPHISLFVTSDAAASLYDKLIQNPFNLLPFSQPIYNMLLLEAGYLFDNHFEDYPHNEINASYATQALVLPSKLEDFLTEGLIYNSQDNNIEEPEGILLSTKIFSTIHGQYVIPTLLKGDINQWDNKMVSVSSKDKKQSIQAKIIANTTKKIQEVA